MCEQTPVEYKSGDIVWVKLRSCWWPGEVKDWESVPPELAELKNKSICAVKFFEEDTYEIVKDLNNIYIYNCKRKNDFIKKGLDMYRKENPFMKKFPGDVSFAEEKTGGNPDIIDSPMFAPEEKKNYTSIIFGTSPTKLKKRGRKSLKTPTHTVTSTPLSRRSLPIITHRRFLGEDDHQVRILIQSPEEKRDMESNNVYTCPTCGFQTSRVGVIVLHNKSHIQGVYSPVISTGKKTKKSPPKKAKKGIRMTHSKTSSFDEDLALLQQGIFPMDSSDEEFYDDEEDEDEPKVKKRRKTPKVKKPMPKKPKHNASQDILAEWDNDDDEEEEELNKTKEQEDVKKDSEEKAQDKEKETSANENAVKSCFDFDEEEEEVVNVLGKIQSPSTDSKNDNISKSPEASSSLKEDVVAESSKNSEEHISDNKEVQNDNEKSTENVQVKQTRRSARNSGKTGLKNNVIPDETKESHEIMENSCSKDKEEENHKENEAVESKDEDPEKSKISEPQKSSEATPEVQEPEPAEKTTRYKPRSRKQRHEKREDICSDSFEISSPSTSRELEQPEPSEVPPKKSQRKSKLIEKPSETDKNNRRSHIPNFEEFEELMQATAVPSVPDVPDTLKEQQNFPLAKMKKFPDKDEPPLHSVEETKSSNETATKHTNPKKRFVKAFEDLEMEEKKKSEKKDLEMEEKKKSEKKDLEMEEKKKSEKKDLEIEEKKKSEKKDLEMEEKKKSEKKDLENAEQEDKSRSDSKNDLTEKSNLKEEPESSSKENQSSKTDTEKIEETKGLEVFKLKSQIRTKLAENTDDQIIPKYKKFEMRRIPRKLTETSEQTRPSTRSAAAEKSTKRPLDIETIQHKMPEAVVLIDKQELSGISGRASSVDASSSNSANQDCLVRKKIEITPKNHGEINITVTKVLENNNAKGEAPFKKYLYSKRQGRYSVKYRSKLAYLDSPKQPDNVDQSSQDGKSLGNDKSIVSPVSVPTVEEIEFPKTSIQRTVTRQSLRQKDAHNKSDIPSVEDQESEAKVHEEPYQQKVTRQSLRQKDAHKSDIPSIEDQESEAKVHEEPYQQKITRQSLRQKDAHNKCDIPSIEDQESEAKVYEEQYQQKVTRQSLRQKDAHNKSEIPSIEDQESEAKVYEEQYQQKVTRQSLRQKDAHTKSEIPSIEDQESEAKVYEEQYQQKVTRQSLRQKDAHNKGDIIPSIGNQEIETKVHEEEEEEQKDKNDSLEEDKNIEKAVDAEKPKPPEINDNEELAMDTVEDKLIETTTKALGEELGIERSKKKEPKTRQKRRGARKTKRDEDSDTNNEDMDIENADKLEININELPVSQEETKVENALPIEKNVTDDNKMQQEAQESLEEYVDIMTVTPKKKKTFGKPPSIIEPLKSDITFPDNSEIVSEPKQATVEDNVNTVNEKLHAEIIEEVTDKEAPVPENLNGSFIIDETPGTVPDRIISSEKQTSLEQEPENKNEPSHVSIEENEQKESSDFIIEDVSQKEDQIDKELPQQENLTLSEPLITNKDSEPQPIIEFPTEDEVSKRTDEIVISENESEKPREILEETVSVKENQVEETKNEIEDIQSNASTKEDDTKPLPDLVSSERRSIEETDKVMATVFVTTPDNEKEELSALSTLAAVSELSPPLEEQTSLEKIKAIEANLTVVSQTDLENVQVEIVNTPESKPVTLTNFSVDFTDGKQEIMEKSSKLKQCIESSNTEIPPEELPYATKKSTSITKVATNDSEDQMSSLKENSVQTKATEEESDQAMTSSKLLEILTDNCKSVSKPFAAEPTEENVVFPISKTHITPSKDVKIKLPEPTISNKESTLVQEIKPQEIRSTKTVVKSAISEKRPPLTKPSKPSALFTEKIMKPSFPPTETVSVQKVTSKRTNKDIEDIDTFIIQKPTKKLALDSDSSLKLPFSTATPVIKKTVSTPKGRGKAKILQQTIITPAGDVIQPEQQQPEEAIFDINSMPIVLGDQILTPESIESMPVVISESAVSVTPAEKVPVVKRPTPQLRTINKIPSGTSSQPTIIRTYASAQKLSKGQKNYQVASSKIIKSSPAIMSQSGNKPGKFIIVSPNAAGTSKSAAGKKTMSKQSVILPATSETLEPVGNKIMIVTNQQGQQQRVLITPAQQKMLGYQSPSTKLTKAALKSGIMTKSSKSLPAIISQNSGNVIAQTTISTKAQAIAGNQTFISSGGQVLIPITQAKQRVSKSDVSKTGGKKVQTPATKGRLQEALKSAGASKTIVIKNQQGQIVKKIQGTDDALLEQQVQEQVQAIKASSSFTALKTQNKIEALSKTTKSPTKRSYLKKPEILQKPLTTTVTATVHSDAPPPLTALSSSSSSVKPETNKVTHVEETKVEQPTQATEEKPKEQGHLNELIIQDSLGNQMTITEGQILALPSETVDGQTQSYMLVSLDKSGNLTPLNNEALLSLDPNLAIGGGDLSNIVLQVDDRGVVVAPAPAAAAMPEEKEKPKTETQKPLIVEEPVQKPVPPLTQIEQAPVAVTDTSTAITLPSAVEAPPATIATEENQTITCSVDTGNNQQLIISGDPISTQKFIESLTEGNADLANLLASAEGNILIHTDGQQILINTESENQLLLPVNSGNVAIESTEGGGNPIFATQSNKNQDILAAALADTDVFQQEQPTVQSKLPQSQLSPNSSLFPMNVGNVLETSLTLSSPIMTPLEVPSSNSKKIPDEESDILTTEVPKNVDLPITITDPNISQTVAQQQVATLMATELQNNLDLPLTIADQGISVSSTEMNSPSYVYSLPSLDDSVDMNQKAFGNAISMPLLNEETELTTNEKTDDSEKGSTIEPQTEAEKPKELEEEDNERSEDNDDKRSHSPVSSSFMSSMDGGLCTLGGAMCSSLSEPPPDMFDLSSNYLTVDDTKKDDVHIPEPNTNSNDSQPNFSNNHESLEEEEERFRSNGPKRTNFLNDNSVLRNRSPVANIDENSAEIPLQPMIVAHIPDKETQETECSSLESERSEGSSDSLLIHHEGAPPSTESSSDTAPLNSESSILDSSKRKSDDELDLSTQKKPRVD